MNRIKTITGAILCGIITLMLSCKKEVNNNMPLAFVDSSHISITNASPSIANLQFFLNNNFVPFPDTPVSFGKTVFQSYIFNATTYHPDTLRLPYITINPGFNELGFKTYGNGDVLSRIDENFDPGSHYSLFLVDTLIHGKVNSVFLKDNLQKSDSTKSQIRFLNLSPDAPPMDVWAYPNGGPDGYKIFSNCGYIPGDFDSFIQAQNFSFINRGPYFFIATESGTSNVLLAGQMFIYGKTVITLYTKGYAGGTGANSLDVGVIQYQQ